MKVRMQIQFLTPGMQYREEPDVSTEILLLLRDRQQGVPNRLKKQVVDQSSVSHLQRNELMRQSKNSMEILKGKNLMLFPADPLFLLQKLTLGTMPVPAGMEDLHRMAALFTDLNASAEFLRTARLKGRHNLSFMA